MTCVERETHGLWGGTVLQGTVLGSIILTEKFCSWQNNGNGLMAFTDWSWEAAEEDENEMKNSVRSHKSQESAIKWSPSLAHLLTIQYKCRVSRS